MIAHCARKLLHSIASHAEKSTTTREFIAPYAWNTSSIAQANHSIRRASRLENQTIQRNQNVHSRLRRRSPGQANSHSTKTIQSTEILFSSGIFNNAVLNLAKVSGITCIMDNNRTNPDLHAKTSTYQVLPQMTIVSSALEPGAPMLVPAPTPFLHALFIQTRYPAVRCATHPTYTRARSSGYKS